MSGQVWRVCPPLYTLFYLDVQCQFHYPISSCISFSCSECFPINLFSVEIPCHYKILTTFNYFLHTLVCHLAFPHGHVPAICLFKWMFIVILMLSPLFFSPLYSLFLLCLVHTLPSLPSLWIAPESLHSTSFILPSFLHTL